MNSRTRCEYLYYSIDSLVKHRTGLAMTVRPNLHAQTLSSDSDRPQTSVVLLIMIVNKPLTTLVKQPENGPRSLLKGHVRILLLYNTPEVWSGFMQPMISTRIGGIQAHLTSVPPALRSHTCVAIHTFPSSGLHNRPVLSSAHLDVPSLAHVSFLRDIFDPSVVKRLE